MRAWLAQTLDRIAIRMACAAVGEEDQKDRPPSSDHRPALSTEGLFETGPIEVPDLKFSDARSFSFLSAVATPWAENNQVAGRLICTSEGDWRSRPVVVLLHGWNAELQYRFQFPSLARRLNRAGLNAAMIVLPYHGSRKPRQPGAVQNFISCDLIRVAEAARQAMADIRSLLDWLDVQGVAASALWGVSLGGWLAGLVITLEHCADSAVLMTPIVQMDRAILELPFCAPIRKMLHGSGAELAPFNLTSRPLKCPSDRVLLIQSDHDMFVPVETIDQLWDAWGHPTRWRVPHGHISLLLSPRMMDRTVKWLAGQLAC